ncbi:MAG: dihydroorotate dehydrogenase [Clostridia bacterium]|nr:dihydroorotate dehydrogenase [Clostridia bacterium]MCI9458993.1 dihydroorotate dehydrogenase [Clostridia bacterium]
MKTTIAGVTFKNPIITASGTFGFGREYNEFYDVGLLGGICSKGLTLEPRQGNDPVRIAETPSGLLNSVGLQNPGVEHFIEHELPFMKSTGSVVIANAAGSTESDYVKIVERLSSTDVDMIELNISCPNVKCGGMAFGVSPDGVYSITKAVRKVCKKPLMIKLTPNVSDIADNARAAERGGADAISLINTVAGMAVDYKTRRPVLKAVGGGLSGPCVKPIALRMVYAASKAVSIPVVGMGGVMTGEDAAEFMLCGASAVQVGSANIFDPYAALRIVNELTKLAERDNINDITSLIGGLRVE